jgi:hypothetical protein
MKDDSQETQQRDHSPANPTPAKLDEITALRIADWLHQDLLFKAGLPTEPDHSSKRLASQVSARKSLFSLGNRT